MFPLLHLDSPWAGGARGFQQGARVSQEGVKRGADALSQGTEVVATLGEVCEGGQERTRHYQGRVVVILLLGC